MTLDGEKERRKKVGRALSSLATLQKLDLKSSEEKDKSQFQRGWKINWNSHPRLPNFNKTLDGDEYNEF